jgi:glycosyltransferase involved in cell wall biosynthesis/GT2 family glycosyltransferase
LESSTQQAHRPVYILVTPARDEAEHIEHTIRSVTSQSILPCQWIIISDNSQDCTDKIVEQYAQHYDFIKLIRLDSNRHRDFASKVYAQKAGIQHINGIQYDFFGFLDADVSFEPNSFEQIFAQFKTIPDLGIAGGTIYERDNGHFREIAGNRERSVGGQFQIFRRECFQQVELLPLRYGGEDTVVENSAAMKGWIIRSFPELQIYHHKSPQTFREKLKTSYIYGEREYACKTHPVYVMAKCVRRLWQKPYVLSSLARIAGYFRALVCRYPRDIPDDIAQYMRQEQLQRLRGPVFRKKQKIKKGHRVCIMAKYRYPMYSRLVQQARVLAEAGIEIDVVCLRTEGQSAVEKLGRITVHRVCRERKRDGFLRYLWFTFCFMTASFLKLQQLLVKNASDVLVVHTLPEYMVLAGVTHKVLRKKIVLDAVDLSVEVFESKWGHGKLAILKPLVLLSEKISCWFSNHIVAASPGFRERLIQRHVKPEKITVMMNAADTTVFTFDEQRRFDVIAENAKLFYHGTVAKRFGLAEAIQATAIIQNRIPGSTLQIYGRYHSEYKQQLETLISELDLEDKVRLGGLQPHEKIRELIRSSDIGLVPYQSDDFMNIALSTKMFEYAASGIPIAASRLRPAESIFNDNCVSFAKPGDPGDLAEKIIDLCLHPNHRKKQVQAAFEVNAKVAGPVMAERFKEAIFALLKEQL